eukprot:14586009-Alexandrium_andersonii.AAC.1
MPPARRPRRAARRFAAADTGRAGSCGRTWCDADSLACTVTSIWSRDQVPRTSWSGSAASPSRDAANSEARIGTKSPPGERRAKT